jgi:DMSO/TMAO reductase YedYZ molybdopterin-dependent catalytic subunit
MGDRDTAVRLSRRRLSAGLFSTAGWIALAGGSLSWGREAIAAAAAVAALPGKLPTLKRLTQRPPNYETPLEYFRSALTPNEAFFVRYHHPVIPQISAADFRLEIGGPAAERSLVLTLAELRGLPASEVVAVCQCAGNRRGLFNPPVAGLQWGHGAMGNACWRGVRLGDVLARIGLKPGAIEVSFDAADAAPLEGTPDFIKSLPMAKALHPDTLLAYEMNGQPLPEANGFPLRLVVPGWTATYWIKHVNRISVLDVPEKNWWMSTAYRMPRAAFPLLERFPSQEAGERTPVTEIAVNSLITAAPASGVMVAGRDEISGIAWDAGHGLDRVEASFDGGASWLRCTLGEDLGRYSFRRWRLDWPALAPGRHELWVRAANRVGQVQIEQAIPNPSGYQHNAYHRVTVEVRS